MEKVLVCKIGWVEAAIEIGDKGAIGVGEVFGGKGTEAILLL